MSEQSFEMIAKTFQGLEEVALLCPFSSFDIPLKQYSNYIN